MAPRLLIALALFFVAAAPARADLVELNWAHAHRGAQLARAAGGTELAHELRIWRVPSYATADLRRAGVVRVSEPDRLFQTLAAAQLQATDPLVPLQWWRAAIGSDQVESPGAGKPVTVVDSGVDLTHPEFATRPNTTALNAQTTTDVDEDHGTEVSSVIAAPNNGVGIVGIYPDAVLRVWDASPFGSLNEGAAIAGIYEAARRGPGVINLSFGGEDDDPLLDDAIRFAFRSGSLVVAAAGNDALSGNPPNFPAFYPHVLTVGATNEAGHIASFSTISPKPLRVQHRRFGHELRVAAGCRRCRLGVDGATRARQHAAVRGDAPVGYGHRRARVRQRLRLRAAEPPGRAQVQGTSA